ncbi:hypothetical protein GBA52_019306 [Prunus armeniaca]|nr:hypothetical protein GBA52_019306 [Prunus armeniaca]
MTMDRRLRAFSDSFNGVQLGNRVLPILSHPNIVAQSQFDSNTFLDNNYREFNYPQPVLTPNNVSSYASVSPEDDSQEDCDFSDVVLKYINQMLMEEDMEDKTCMLQESLELQAAEKSFYEVLGKKYPPSPELHQDYAIQYGESPGDSFSGTGSNYITSTCNSGGYFSDNTLIQSPDGYLSQLKGLPAYSISQSRYGSSTRVSSLDGQVDSPSSLHMPDLNTESQSVWQFKKGVEEASRFLPGETKLVVNLEANGLSAQVPKVGTNGEVVKIVAGCCRDGRDELSMPFLLGNLLKKLQKAQLLVLVICFLALRLSTKILERFKSLEVLKNFVTLTLSKLKSYSARGIWSWPAYRIWYLSLTTTIEMEFDSPGKAIQDNAQKKLVFGIKCKAASLDWKDQYMSPTNY